MVRGWWNPSTLARNGDAQRAQRRSQLVGEPGLASPVHAVDGDPSARWAGERDDGRGDPGDEVGPDGAHARTIAAWTPNGSARSSLTSPRGCGSVGSGGGGGGGGPAGAG